METQNNYTKKQTFSIAILLTCILMSLSYISNAGVFTANASGDWSSSATWAGGVSPGSDISSHQVTIASGVTVNLDVDVMMNGNLSSLDVDGALQGSTHAVTVIEGTVTGSGQMIVDELEAGANALLLYAGSINANTFINGGAAIVFAATATVNDEMHLNGGTLQIANGSALSLQSDATIVMNGGQMSLTGGVFTATNTYHVTYNGNSTTTGIEVMGSGLSNVQIDLSGTSQQLTLNNDLELNGDLVLSQGQVVIGNHSLEVSGTLNCTNGSGSILSSSSSDITVKGSGSSSLSFTGGSGTVGMLMIDIGSGSTVQLNSDVQVDSDFSLSSGTVDLNGNSVTVMGDFTGIGTFMGGSGSGIMIQSSGSISGSITFESGSEMIDQLMIDIDSNESIMLGSDVSVSSMFNHQSGNLNLGNNNTLDVWGQITFGSQAMINANQSSNIEIHSTGSATGSIQFDSNNNTVGHLTIDASNNGMVSLGSSVNVNGNLSLENGSLDLNGNMLHISGDIAASGSGNISANGNGSSITIQSTGDVSGMLHFHSTNNELDNLAIDISSNGTVWLGSDAEVSGTLDLQDGYISIGNSDLTVSGTITGGTSDSYVVTMGDGQLEVTVTAGAQGSFYPVGTDVDFAPITLVQASGSTTGMFGVNAMSEVYADGYSGTNMADWTSVVNTSWNIESSISSGIDLSMTAEWSASMEANGFARANSYISHYTNSMWDVSATGSATLNGSGRYEISRSGITSLSPFAVFDSNTAVGIDEEPVAIEATLYPNPVATELTYNLGEYNGIVVIEIYDNSSRLIRNYQVNEPIGSIDMESLAPGYYTIRFSNGAELVDVGRVVKQ